jgi:trans-2-enoyl-CoA reductase
LGWASSIVFFSLLERRKEEETREATQRKAKRLRAIMVPQSQLLPLTLQILSRRHTSGCHFSTAPSPVSPLSKDVLYDEHGAPDQVLRVADVPPIHLGEHDVCVRMLATPIDPSDINR